MTRRPTLDNPIPDPANIRGDGVVAGSSSANVGASTVVRIVVLPAVVAVVYGVAGLVGGLVALAALTAVLAPREVAVMVVRWPGAVVRVDPRFAPGSFLA